mmetsp:Transcript_1774/g.1225  ORF Transcript_1774/g.1225 Transcript_1774/m.1225 type:complete len:116 (+) Transcript_1774:208-555(+)
MCSYLNDTTSLLATKCSASNSQQLQDVELLEEALKIRAVQAIQRTLSKMASSSASMNEQINSLFAVDIVRMTLLHMRFLAFRIFKEDVLSSKFTDPNVRSALMQLVVVLGCYELS